MTATGVVVRVDWLVGRPQRLLERDDLGVRHVRIAVMPSRSTGAVTGCGPGVAVRGVGDDRLHARSRTSRALRCPRTKHPSRRCDRVAHRQSMPRCRATPRTPACIVRGRRVARVGKGWARHERAGSRRTALEGVEVATDDHDESDRGQLRNPSELGLRQPARTVQIHDDRMGAVTFRTEHGNRLRHAVGARHAQPRCVRRHDTSAAARTGSRGPTTRSSWSCARARRRS